MTGPLRAARNAFLQRRHTALLVAIVALAGVRPLFGSSGMASVGFSLALLVLMLVALFTSQIDELVGEREALLAQLRRRRVVGWVLVIPAIAERLIALAVPNREIYLFGAFWWLAFFAFVTWSELRSVLRQKAITGDTIRMSVSVYLLIGLSWAMLYVLILQFDPASFNLGPSFTPAQNALLGEEETFPILVYFSMTTLTTVGYGDITPVSLGARYAAVAEAVTGPLYLTILVARLVGMRGGGGPRPRDSDSP